MRRQKGLSGGIAGFFQRPFVEIEAKAGTPRVDLYDEDDAAPALPPPPRAGTGIARPSTHAAARGALREQRACHLRRRGASANSSWTTPSRDSPARPARVSRAHARRPARASQRQQRRATSARRPAIPSPRRSPRPRPRCCRSQRRRRRRCSKPRLAPEPPASHDRDADAGPARARAGEDRREPARLRCRRASGARADRDRGGSRAAADAGALEPGARGARTIAQRIPVAPPLPVGSATIALVGPGGSGKTACCAALLEAYRERSTLPAACATVLPGDTPGELEVLLSPAVLEPTPIAAPEVAQALRAARADGLLLLDLPALSPADRGSIKALAALLRSLKPDRVIVALPGDARREARRAAAGGAAPARRERAGDHARRRDRPARRRRGGGLRFRPRAGVPARSRPRPRRADPDRPGVPRREAAPLAANPRVTRASLNLLHPRPIYSSTTG